MFVVVYLLYHLNFSSSGILQLRDRIRARYCNVLLHQSSNYFEVFAPKTFLLKSRHPPHQIEIFSTQKILELKILSTQSIPPGPSEALHRLFSSTKDTCAKLLKTHRAM